MGEAKGQREGKTVLMMLGTKGDLEEKRVVGKERVEEVCRENGVELWFEVRGRL